LLEEVSLAFAGAGYPRSPLAEQKHLRVARYRKTFFDRDQFIEDVKFDRFELRME